MILLYWFSLLVLIWTLTYASALDIMYRRVPFEVWYPTIILTTLSTIVYLMLNTLTLVGILIPVITVIVFYICGRFNLYGGADAWALILITIGSITIPFHSILNNVDDGVGISTYINALILLLFMYLPSKYIFKEENVKAPFIPYIYLGFIITLIIGNIYKYIIGVFI